MPEPETTAISVTVEYFAVLRDCAGKNSESLALESAWPAAVYDQLQARYRFPLDRSRIHLAVNGEFAAWDQTLRPGDTVVFLPPVCGG